MARIILHVGAHKTATSFLQASFFRNRALLARHGLIYPDIGPNDAHHALAALWMEIADLDPAFFAAASPQDLWDRLTDRHARAPGTLLLSAENFTRFAPQRVDIPHLARLLRNFEEVCIVYTVRRQSGLLSSLWTQVAKTREAPNVAAYVRRALHERMGGNIPLDHNAVYDWLRTGFAAGQIRILDYDRIRRAPGGVLQAFLDLAGVPLRAEALDPVPPALANVSPDPLALWLASQIAPGRGVPEDLLALVETALYHDGRRPSTLLTRAEHAGLLARFRRPNIRLSGRVRLVQPDFDFADPPPPADMLYRDDIGPETWARIAAALYAGRPETPAPADPPLRRLLRRVAPPR